MVLLTYRRNGAAEAPPSISEDETAEKDRIIKDDAPKTAYIDKLENFRQHDALYDKCDLIFICNDGEVCAHRLVISNASEFIMAMQNDQPLWYPVYISVPDLTKEIVQTLVQLAYTGEMNLPSSTSPDELLDAMQALGWVNQDCLTASYTDAKTPALDEEAGPAVSSKTTESLENVLKMSFPVSTKEADASDDENGMELDLPDVPVSDEEENKVAAIKGKKKATKKAKEPEKSRRSTRSAKTNATEVEPKPKPEAEPKPKPQQKKQALENTPEKPKPATTSRTTKAKAQTVATSKPDARKNKKNVKCNDNNSEPAPPTPEKNEKFVTKDNDIAEVIASPDPVRSRTRTIRKPKKFDDAIVLTPTKRKESPIKSPPKLTGKAAKKPEATEVNKDEKSETAPTNSTSKKVPARGRRNTSLDNKEAIRNSLITSYFNKRSSTRKSGENSEEAKVDTNDLKEPSVEEDKALDSLNENGNNDVENNAEPENETAEAEVAEETTDPAASPPTLRGRSKSNASSKGDKDNKNEVNEDSSPPNANKRKRNQELTENDNNEEATVPAKRDRKASTISNASKSSK